MRSLRPREALIHAAFTTIAVFAIVLVVALRSAWIALSGDVIARTVIAIQLVCWCLFIATLWRATILWVRFAGGLSPWPWRLKDMPDEPQASKARRWRQFALWCGWALIANMVIAPFVL